MSYSAPGGWPGALFWTSDSTQGLPSQNKKKTAARGATAVEFLFYNQFTIIAEVIIPGIM